MTTWTQFCPSLTTKWTFLTFLSTQSLNVRSKSYVLFIPYFCLSFLVFWSLQLSIFSPFCISCITKCKQRLYNIFVFSYYDFITKSDQKPKTENGMNKKKTQRTKQRLSFRSCISESRCCMFREHTTSRDLSNGKNSQNQSLATLNWAIGSSS